MSPEKQASVTNSVFHGKINPPQALFFIESCVRPRDVGAQRIETDNLISCGSKISWPASETTKYMLAVSNSRHRARLETSSGSPFMTLPSYSGCASLHISVLLCRDLSPHVRMLARCCREPSLLDCQTLSWTKDRLLWMPSTFFSKYKTIIVLTAVTKKRCRWRDQVMSSTQSQTKAQS